MPGDLPQQRGQQAGAEFGHAVQRDGAERVANIGIAKAAQHRIGKRIQLVTRLRQRRDNLITQRALNKLRQRAVVHRFSHRLQPGQKRHRHHGGVRAVEDRHLALFIGFDVVHQADIQRQAVEPQLVGQRWRPLDHQLVIDLPRHQVVVAIAQFGLYPGGIVGVAGNNAVHQRGAKEVVLLNPLHKGGGQLPVLRGLPHAAQQRGAVIVDQFTGQHHPALVRRAVKVLPALKQQPRQLRREAGGRCGVQPILRVKVDPRFGGIGNHNTQQRIARQRQKLGKLFCRLDLTIQRADQPRFAHHFTLRIDAADQRGIQPVLMIQAARAVAAARPDHHDPGIEIAVLVEQIDLPVDKGA